MSRPEVSLGLGVQSIVTQSLTTLPLTIPAKNLVLYTSRVFVLLPNSVAKLQLHENTRLEKARLAGSDLSGLGS